MGEKSLTGNRSCIISLLEVPNVPSPDSSDGNSPLGHPSTRFVPSIAQCLTLLVTGLL